MKADGGGRVGFLFPGQGAQHARMLEGVRDLPDFAGHYGLVCALTGTDIQAEIDRGNLTLLRENRFSSLLTVLVGALSLAQLRRHDAEEPCCAAGYSIGQWTALHAAGVLDFATLAQVVLARAEYMDACMQGVPCGMVAVLGLPLAAVEQVLETLRADGSRVYLSNVNCPGNYSIAGTMDALALALPLLEALQPKKLSPVPVSGAWHCPILADAERHFAEYLADVPLAPAAMPVMDNVSGQWLPDDPALLRRRLAEHLSSPVQWQAGMRHCIAATGCRRFLELGYGGSLTRLGFFLDRGTVFESFDLSDPARIPAALRDAAEGQWQCAE